MALCGQAIVWCGVTKRSHGVARYGLHGVVWPSVAWDGLAWRTRQQRGYYSKVEVPLDRLVSTQFHLAKTELRAARRLNGSTWFFIHFCFKGGWGQNGERAEGVRGLDPRGVIRWGLVRLATRELSLRKVYR